MLDLASELPRLLPRAVDWAESMSLEAFRVGAALGEDSRRLAEAVGVARTDLVRIVEVPALPSPEDSELREAALGAGLLGPGMVGLTLGHAVFIVYGHGSSRLMSHEFRHVYQYEQAGSIQKFLPVYLQQIVQYGYQHAPLEMDARAHERDGA